MRSKAFACCVVVLLAGGLCSTLAAQSVPTAKSSITEAAQKSKLAENYGRLPLSFEINQGQTDPQVKFLSRGAGQTLFLTSNEAVLALSKPLDQKPDSLDFRNLSASHSARTTLLRMRLLGSNPLSDVTGLETLPGMSNYFLGNDPAKWRTNVPTYGKVRYSQIYPGIDLVYYGNQRQLEYDFVVAPGADPAQIRLAIRGANKLSIDADGNAIVRCKDGDVRLLRPRLYQEVRGEKVEVAGGYALKRNELRFVVAPYDHTKKLVIDPVLVYSTYLGGVNGDGASGVAVDSAGNAYVVGTTQYGGFPVTSGVVQPTIAGTQNVFVAKLNAAGTALVYSTYLGGNGQDTGYAIAVDSSGSAYVTGATFASNFPITSGAFQTTTKPVSTPGSTVFVSKLSPDGTSLAYSTYLGGSANDQGFAIAVDASGSAYVVGETQSGNFPVRGSSPKVLGGPLSCDSLNSGGFDGFITKFNAAGDTVAYSLYLGGSGNDVATGVAVDSSGDAYASGYTTSKDFLVFNTCPGPGPGATSLQSANAGADNGFIVKVSPDGLAFLGSTYLGGSGQDAITSIAVDGSGFVYLAGEGNSGGAGGFDAFGAKLNGSLSSKVYFNYIGGSGFDRATGVAVDSAGNEYLVGQTASTNFPQVSPIQPAFGGGTYDAFVTELDSSGTIVFSTYLGGSGDENTSIGGGPIAVDSSGNIYVAGSTTSTNFPGVSSTSIQTANGGGSDAFIVKLGPSAAPTVTTLLASLNPSVFGQQVSFTVTVSPSSSSSLTPSGNVTISDGSTTLGTLPLASGTAIFNTSTLTVGSHSITASYGADSNFSASTSTPLTQVVNEGATTTSLVASPNPGIVGQPVTLTATIAAVASAVGTPTGIVTFLDGSTSLGTGALGGGQATFTTSSLSAGSHSITATYAGDSNFLGSSSSTLTLGIQQITTTTLLAVPNPANAAQLVTLTAAVAGSSGSPTGETVTFFDGATVMGTGTISAGGMATFTTASLAVGNHGLTASYSGDSNFTASTSATLTLSVLLPPAVITDNETITVTDTTSFPDVFDAESVKVTDQVTVYAYFPIAINPAPPILSGVLNQPYSSVTFSGAGGYQSLTLSESGTVPGMAFAISGPSTTFSGTPTQAGTFPFTITATDSIGNKLNQSYSLVVSASCPAISVLPSGSLGIVTAGNPFSQAFTAAGGAGTTTWSTVSALPLGISFSGGVLSGIPTQSGTFALTITATDKNGCQGGSNVSLVVLPPPAVITDNETITVTDAASFPDVFDAESIKVTDKVFVQVISPTTTSISAPGVVFGMPAAVTVSVGSPYGTVSGNVTLSVDGGAPTTMPLSGGSAIFNLGVLTVGNHSVATNFSAQANFMGSSAQTKFTVNQATPTIAWTNPVPLTYGTPLSGKQLNATASAPGTFIYTPPLGTVLSAGSQTLSVSFAPSDIVDYTKAAASVTLVVNQATPTITWANPAPIIYGTALSSTELNATASFAGAALPGTFVYNPPLKTVLNPGTQNLSVTFTPTDTRDYQTETQTVSVTVNVNGNLSIQPGQTYKFTNGSISGTVTINGGTLILNGSAVGSNLMMTSGSLTLGGKSSVGGNLQIHGGSFTIGLVTITGNMQITKILAGSAPGVVCGATVNGSLQFQSNAISGQIGPASCAGNTIGGNLQITGNTAPLQIYKNTVGGNLQVQSNTGAAQVFQNTVQNLLQCSGNSSPFTGGRNTAAAKQGQCASF